MSNQSASNVNAVVREYDEQETNEIAGNTKPTVTSHFFEMPFWQRMNDIECRLSVELKNINFHSQNVAAVYNPLEYAAELHCDYLQKYLDGPKTVLFVGMNPGPFGMVQTAVISIHRLHATINHTPQSTTIKHDDEMRN